MKTNEKNTWKFLTQSFTRDLHDVLLQQHHATQPIALAGLDKQQVFEQMKQSLAESELDVSALKNELHYEFPNHELERNAAFSIGDPESIQEIIFYRHNSEIVISKMASNFEKAEPVRIWPHHFDTGTFVPLRFNPNGSISRSIGLGWTIPDDMVNEQQAFVETFFNSGIRLLREHYNL